MAAIGSTITMTRTGLVDIELVAVYEIINGGAPSFIENYEVPRSVVDDLLVYNFAYPYVVGGNVGDSIVVRFDPIGVSADQDSFDYPAITVEEPISYYYNSSMSIGIVIG